MNLFSSTFSSHRESNRMIQATLAQHIIENLNTAVLWFTPQLTLYAINPAAENLLEVSAKQAHEVAVDHLLAHPKLNASNLHQLIEKRYSMIERGLRLQTLNAKTITVDCSITPIQDMAYANHLLVELLQVDQHLRIAREESLLQQQQTTRNVIRGLAHEIKNPLGGLRGAAQLLERELPDSQLREYTDIIIGEADRLQSLLNRMMQPVSFCNKRKMNIHQILMRVRQLTLSEVNKGLQIHCDFDPSIPELYADPDQLIQAILNILRNATQAMKNQGLIQIRTRIHRQMTVGNKRHKLVLRIDISDDGPGIPENLLEQIFYPLVTGYPEGSGLGLSIAQTLLNQHNGLIECNSQPGKTTFTLWIPVENQFHE